MKRRASWALLPTLVGLGAACNALVGIPGSESEGTDAAAVGDAEAGTFIILPPRRDAAHDAPRDAPRDGARDGAADVAVDAGRSVAIAVSSGLTLQDWCVVTATGSVWCWGDNETGQLGPNAGLVATTPVEFTGIPDPVASVAVGYFTICALTKPGGVFCWGYGADGELGNGTMTIATASPVPVEGLSAGVLEISGANLESCAIKGDGSAWCWGVGVGGTLGNGASNNSLSPTTVTGLDSGVTSISVGADAVCAVQNGGVLCWGGSSGLGELGDGTLNESDVPVAVPTLASGVKTVAAGFNFMCALTEAGAVMCWGEGDMGELGNGEVANSPVPVQVSGLSSGVVAITAGNETGCALKNDGSVWCWGYGDDGQLGTGATMFGTAAQPLSAVPVQVPGLADVTSLSAGNAPCVTTKRGEVECWGFTAETLLYPAGVLGIPGYPAGVTLGGSEDSMAFACAIDSAFASVACWGGGGSGQLADGRTTNTLSANASDALMESTTSISSGAAADFACAVSGGLVLCWGANAAGQLGNNSTETSSTPVAAQVPTGVQLRQVSAGHESACGVSSTGAIYCWGDNTYGELGDGTTVNRHVPAAVSGITNAVQVSVGIFYACAVLTDGTVDCWGNNDSGMLGDGTVTAREIPTPVAGLTNAVSVATGWYSTCAVTTAGTVECWGVNHDAQLGTGGMDDSPVPVPVVGIDRGAAAVAVGESNACAVVAGGAWCWGTAAIGNGQNQVQLSPVPVVDSAGVALSGVTAITVGLKTSCAVVGNGIQCWGQNSAGQLGDGMPSNELVPTPVPGFP